MIATIRIEPRSFYHPGWEFEEGPFEDLRHMGVDVRINDQLLFVAINYANAEWAAKLLLGMEDRIYDFAT